MVGMFFVGRTDVSSDMGLQRSFGVFDTAEQAEEFAARLRSQINGTFVVFEGVEVAPAQAEKQA